LIGLIQKLSPEQIQTLEDNKKLSLELNGTSIELEAADIEINFKDIEGWQVAQSNGHTVALDMTLTPELIKEGLSRELVNRIQNLRKEKGFEVTDKIEIILGNHDILEAAVTANKSYILSETLANDLKISSAIHEGLPLEFDTIKTTIQIKKLES